MRRGTGLGQRDSARARRRLWLARLAVPCSAAPAAVDEQAVDGIWHAVQGRAHGRRRRVPTVPHRRSRSRTRRPSGPHAMPRRRRHWSALPRSVQSRAVPATGKPGAVAVQYLDRPPFSHCGDGTSCSWIPGLRTELTLAKAGGRLMPRRSRDYAYSPVSACLRPDQPSACRIEIRSAGVEVDVDFEDHRTLMPPTGSSWIAVVRWRPRPSCLPHGARRPHGGADRGSRRRGERGAPAGTPRCCRNSRTSPGWSAMFRPRMPGDPG